MLSWVWLLLVTVALWCRWGGCSCWGCVVTAVVAFGGVVDAVIDAVVGNGKNSSGQC